MIRTKVDKSKAWFTGDKVWLAQNDTKTNQTYFVSNTGNEIKTSVPCKNYSQKPFSF
jgi:hypothetical protein